MKNSRGFFTAAALFMAILSDSLYTTTGNQDPIPLRGFIIYTAESWGCLNGQRIREEISTLIAKADKKDATIQEIKNPEDVFNRNELYILIPAGSIAGLSGSFAVRFRCESSKPNVKAFFSVDEARVFQKVDKTWVIALKVRGNDSFTVQMFYSRSPEIKQGWYFCPKARDQHPAQIPFFCVYPLEGALGRMPREKLTERWQNLEMDFNPLHLEQSAAVDKCQALFDMLARYYSVDGDFMLWRLEKITSKNLKEFLQEAASSLGEKTFQVLIELQDGRRIYSSADNFVPHLRQMLGVKLSDGKLLGAEVRIRSGL